jgi:hypothetical protein
MFVVGALLMRYTLYLVQEYTYDMSFKFALYFCSGCGLHTCCIAQNILVYIPVAENIPFRVSKVFISLIYSVPS